LRDVTPFLRRGAPKFGDGVLPFPRGTPCSGWAALALQSRRLRSPCVALQHNRVVLPLALLLPLPGRCEMP